MLRWIRFSSKLLVLVDNIMYLLCLCILFLDVITFDCLFLMILYAFFIVYEVIRF